MRRGPKPQGLVRQSPVVGTSGFTIVETMIFLAVSAAILVSALTLVGGSQNRTEFNQGVRDFQQQIDDIIDNVSTGYTASKEDFDCRVAGGSAPIINGPGGAGTLGQHQDCIFIGKIIKFSQGNQFDVYSVVARRLNTSDVAVTTMADARPVVVEKTRESHTIKNGLKIAKMKVNPGSSNAGSASAIGVFSTLNAGFDTSSGSQGNGKQEVEVVSMPAVVSGSLPPTLPSPATFSALFQSSSFATGYDTSPSTFRNPATGIGICFNGNNGNSVMITVGGNNTATTILKFTNGACT